MKKIILIIMLLIMPMNTLAMAETATSAIVMDINSKRVFFEKNADNKRLIASITKIMTAVLAIENANLDDVVTVGEEVLSMYGSNIYIQLHEKMTLRNLLYGLMLRSGNDAAIVIATYVAGNEEKFVKMMNKKAKEIGMTNTVFSNSHGLDEVSQNYSTARDMALLSSYAMTLEDYRKISETKQWNLQGEDKSYAWTNRNKLLFTYEFATGGKTGYTPKAGRTLVTTSAKDNLSLTSVTLNDGNEYGTHKDMYEYVFNNYKNYLILDKNNFEIDENFYNEEIYIKESFYYPLTKKESEDIKVLVKIIKLDNVKKDDKVGEVIVILNGEHIYQDNVYVKINNSNKNIFDRIKDFFRNLF